MKRSALTIGSSQRLYNLAKEIIPGGTQLLTKRPEMFLPDFWPAYYSKAKGCQVWDLDGNKFIDASYMGIGVCPLGYADQDVNLAVIRAVNNGSMCTLNAPEEVELAKLLLRLHPWAGMVRYARSGGEAMAVAVRVARAKSRRDVVLFCGYHGWHDWYLSANLSHNKALDGHLLPGLNPRGVPRQLKGTSFPFNYNDQKTFLRLVEKYRNRIGVVVLESVRNNIPSQDFISTIRQVTKDLKIVLVVDEITAGFRLNNGGAHLIFGLEPDIAVFAKGISNGFPMAAIIGKKDVMSTFQKIFISSTYWTDRIGPTAALATIKKITAKDVTKHLIKIGTDVQKGWQDIAEKHGIDIEVGGIAPIAHFSFNHKTPLVLKTLFTQFMLENGFLATTAFYASYAHKEKHIAQYLEHADKAFHFIKKAIKKGRPERKLKGPVCDSGFKRLT